MRLLLRLALLAYPRPLRARYAAEIAEFPATPFSVLDVAFAGFRERLDNLLRDIRHAARSLLRTPGATAVALLALALGVGANVAVYSVVRPVLLEPLPFADADNLYVLRVRTPPRPGRSALMSLGSFDFHFLNWREEATRFDAVEAWQGGSQTLLLDDGAELASVAFVSPGFLRLLGLEPRLGRGFAAGDYEEDAPNVALVSERLWRTRLGGSQGLLGRTLILDGEPREVIGVAPLELSRFLDVDIVQPLRLDEAKVRGGGVNYTLGILARLPPGVELDSAREELDAILRSHEEEPYQRTPGASAVADPLDRYLVGDIRSTLEFLWGAVALVLLIACSNVAGVLLVRALARHGETCVRMALGAGTRTLLRQALMESVLLALAGSAAGVLLAYGGVRGMAAFLSDRLPRAEAIAVDAPALAFAMAVAVAVGLLSGCAPVWAATRSAPNDAIRLRPTAATAGRGLGRVQGGLVALQVALAGILLAGAGLFLNSLVRLSRVDIGADSPDAASVSISLPRSLSGASRQAYFRDLLHRVHAMPEVRSASISNVVPLRGFHYGSAFELPGEPPLPKNSPELRDRQAARRTMINWMSEDYFRTVGAQLLAGRELEPGDGLAGNVVVNRRLAEWRFQARIR